MSEALKIEEFSQSDLVLLYDLPAGDAPVEIIRTGTFYHRRHGKFSITEDTLNQIEANFEGGRICADYNHGSLSKDPEAAKAAGWVQKLERQVHPDRVSLMASVEWTEDAKKLIDNGEYRFTSPEFVFDWKDPEDNEFKGAKMLAFAITNRPFLPGMAPLTLYDDGHFGPVLTEIEVKVQEAVMLADESLSQKVEKVSRAFYTTFRESENTWFHVREIYDDRVIVTRNSQGDRKTFQIPYTDDDDVKFAPPEEWTEVREEFVPVEATDDQGGEEELKSLLDPDLVALHGLELEILSLKTPGIRRALRALAKRRRSNLRRVAKGEKPIVKDEKTGKLKKVGAGTLGMNKSIAKDKMNARRKVRRRIKEVERKIAAVDDQLSILCHPGHSQKSHGRRKSAGAGGGKGKKSGGGKLGKGSAASAFAKSKPSSGNLEGMRQKKDAGAMLRNKMGSAKYVKTTSIGDTIWSYRNKQHRVSGGNLRSNLTPSSDYNSYN
jgi:hypothetical protein